jgi:sugar-phosphatase
VTDSGSGTDDIVLRGSAVLFDCDGVLVDSLASVDRAWTRWSRQYGLDADEVLALIHGRRSADTVALLIEPGEQAEAVAAIDGYELEDATSVTAIAGARELVAAVSDGRWAVVTSGKAALARARLEAAGIDAPEVFIAADDVARGKPAPDPYLAAAAALGVRADHTVVVEDSPSGVEAGRRAGAGAVLGVSAMAVDTDADVVVADLRNVAWSSDPAGLVIPRSAALPRGVK